MSFPQLNPLIAVHCSQKKPVKCCKPLVAVSPVSGHFITQQAYLFTVLSWGTLPFPLLALHLFPLLAMLVHQLLSWLPHSHSFSLKSLLRETFPENCMVGAFFRLLSCHLFPTWHLLQPTTIFIVCSSFVICFPNSSVSFRSSGTLFLLVISGFPAPGIMPRRKQVLNHHVSSRQCE